MYWKFRYWTSYCTWVSQGHIVTTLLYHVVISELACKESIDPFKAPLKGSGLPDRVYFISILILRPPASQLMEQCLGLPSQLQVVRS